MLNFKLYFWLSIISNSSCSGSQNTHTLYTVQTSKRHAACGMNAHDMPSHQSFSYLSNAMKSPSNLLITPEVSCFLMAFARFLSLLLPPRSFSESSSQNASLPENGGGWSSDDCKEYTTSHIAVHIRFMLQIHIHILLLYNMKSNNLIYYNILWQVPVWLICACSCGFMRYRMCVDQWSDCCKVLSVNSALKESLLQRHCSISSLFFPGYALRAVSWQILQRKPCGMQCEKVQTANGNH